MDIAYRIIKTPEGKYLPQEAAGKFGFLWRKQKYIDLARPQETYNAAYLYIDEHVKRRRIEEQTITVENHFYKNGGVVFEGW